MAMLDQAILDDLNRTITKSMLGTDVLSDPNASPATGSITMSMLEQDILDDLNRTITKSMLGTDVLSDLNAESANWIDHEMSMLDQAIPAIRISPAKGCRARIVVRTRMRVLQLIDHDEHVGAVNSG